MRTRKTFRGAGKRVAKNNGGLMILVDTSVWIRFSNGFDLFCMITYEMTSFTRRVAPV